MIYWIKLKQTFPSANDCNAIFRITSSGKIVFLFNMLVLRLWADYFFLFYQFSILFSPWSEESGGLIWAHAEDELALRIPAEVLDCIEMTWYNNPGPPLSLDRGHQNSQFTTLNHRVSIWTSTQQPTLASYSWIKLLLGLHHLLELSHEGLRSFLSSDAHKETAVQTVFIYGFLKLLNITTAGALLFTSKNLF